MEGAITPLHILRGLGMVGATVIVQAVTQVCLRSLLDALPASRRGRYLDHLGVMYVVLAVFVLMVGMVGEICLWALLYYVWGELGGFTNSVYFSLASFTSVGASELALSPSHRMVGALESAVGLLMFGWSTALLFEVIQGLRGNRDRH
jgi:hypothetical protein